MIQLVGDITDDPGFDGPGIIRDVFSDGGKTLYAIALDAHFTTLGMCELAMCTPKKLAEMAIEQGLATYDESDGLIVGPVELGQGTYFDPKNQRKTSIADFYWTPECFESFGIL